MEYSALALVCVVALLAYNEISALKKVVRKQGDQLNRLAKMTGQEELSSSFVSAELQEQLRQLKMDGKLVKAIKVLRDETQMDLVDAKQYVDKL